MKGKKPRAENQDIVVTVDLEGQRGLERSEIRVPKYTGGIKSIIPQQRGNYTLQVISDIAKTETSELSPDKSSEQ